MSDIKFNLKLYYIYISSPFTIRDTNFITRLSCKLISLWIYNSKTICSSHTKYWLSYFTSISLLFTTISFVLLIFIQTTVSLLYSTWVKWILFEQSLLITIQCFYIIRMLSLTFLSLVFLSEKVKFMFFLLSQPFLILFFINVHLEKLLFIAF